jgi:guanine nucleotide-binding protein subunit alpha
MSKDRTQAIDRRIKDDHRKSRRDYKLVVFGTEDSGKAGLINLTRKAAQVKYSSEELNSYRLLINQNIIREIQNLIRTLIYEGEPRSEVIQEYCELLLNYTVRKDDGKTLERYIGEAIASLWHDLSINTAIKELLGEGFLTPTS